MIQALGMIETRGWVAMVEAAAVLVFSALNVAEEPALVASILVFALNVLLPALAGCIWIGARTEIVGKRFALRREIAI